MRLLLKYKADPNLGRPLTLAVTSNVAITKALLDAGDTNEGLLHLAAKAGRVDIMTVLRDRDGRLRIRDDDGRTPLENAIAAGQDEAVEWLLAQIDYTSPVFIPGVIAELAKYVGLNPALSSAYDRLVSPQVS